MTGSRNASADARAALLEPVRNESRGLDPAVRSALEESLGASFDDVVIHDGAASAALAETQDAAAFTVGRHIVFNTGRYEPGSLRGRALLAHELTHVAQQRRGGGDLDSGFRMPACSLPVHAGRAETEAAGSGTAEGSGTAAGVGIARQTKASEQALPAPTVPMFEYQDESGTLKRVTLAEAEQLRATARKRMLSALSMVEGTAKAWRETHREHLDMGHAESFGDLWDKPSRIWGVAANMRAGIVPPSLSMWSHPLHVVGEARKEIDAGNLAEGARLLRLATIHLNSAKQEWNTFIEATIAGASKLAGELEVVRDTSFAIAIAAGAIVAAPIVAAGVAATGATGGTALALTAVGTGATTATGGAILRGGSDAAAQKVVTGKVDWEKTKKQVKDNLKQDFVTGMTAGLAPGAGQAAGLGKQGLSVSQNIARNVAVQSGVSATTGLTGTALETTTALADGKSWEQARDENLLPGLKSTATNVVSSAVSAPLGPLGQKVAQSRPLLGKALEHGGDAVVTGGTTLAMGGSLEDARNAMITSAVSGAAVRKGKVGSDQKAALKQKPPAVPDADAAATARTAATQDAAEPATAASKAPASGAADGQATEKARAATSVAEVPAKTAATPAKAAQQATAQDVTDPASSPSMQAAPQEKVAKAATAPDAAAPASTPVKDTGKKAASTEPAPIAAPAVAPKRSLSDTKRRTQAGANRQAKEEKRLEVARNAREEAGQAIAKAKQDVAEAQAAMDSRQKEGKPPRAAEKRALARAQRDLAKAQTARSRAKAERKNAQGRLRDAKKDAAERTAEHRAAQAAADAKKKNAPAKAGKRFRGKWNPLRKKAWKQWAAEELAARRAGTSKGPRSEAELAAADAKLAAEQGDIGPDGQIPWDNRQRTRLPGADQDLNPLKAATDAELVEAVRTGSMPPRLEAEIEHKRIPQRVGKWMAEAGVPVDDASRLSKQGDLDNLEPANRKWHSTLDESAARRRPGHDSTDPMSSLDQRTSKPLHDATDAEIADIVDALKKPGVDLDRTFDVEGQLKSWRDILSQEKARRPGAKWSVP